MASKFETIAGKPISFLPKNLNNGSKNVVLIILITINQVKNSIYPTNGMMTIYIYIYVLTIFSPTKSGH